MAIKTLLVPLDGGEASARALDGALKLAKKFTAHVTVLHIRPDPRDTIPLLGEGLSASMIEEMMAAAEREAERGVARARGVFDEALRKAGVPSVDPSPAPGEASATWLEDIGHADTVVSLAGRLSDLIVLARPTEATSPAGRAVLDAALFETGRPVLLVPPEPVDDIGARIAIGWNGSAEAARAVNAGLSFIRKSQETVVVSVADGSAQPEAAPQLVEYLEWHGLDPKLVMVPGEKRPVADTLLDTAAHEGCDLLVMGAYTHSRVRELILGGVTRQVLDTAGIALLMTH